MKSDATSLSIDLVTHGVGIRGHCSPGDDCNPDTPCGPDTAPLPDDCGPDTGWPDKD